MNRHSDTETLTLLREIRDLVQMLVLRDMPLPVPSPDEERPDRKLFTWASIHGNTARHTDT